MAVVVVLPWVPATQMGRMACHQRRQELLTLDHRTGGGLRRQDFRVISRHCRGDQNQLRAGYIFGLMADHDGCAQLGQLGERG